MHVREELGGEGMQALNRDKLNKVDGGRQFYNSKWIPTFHEGKFVDEKWI